MLPSKNYDMMDSKIIVRSFKGKRDDNKNGGD
jgi:hypothetical protein